MLVGGFCTNRKAATRKFGTRLATRTKRVATKSIAAIPAESIPFGGVGLLIVDTGYELYAACKTVRDLDQQYADLGMGDETPDNVMHIVCDPEQPDAEEIWGWDVEKRAQPEIAETINQKKYTTCDWQAKLELQRAEKSLL